MAVFSRFAPKKSATRATSVDHDEDLKEIARARLAKSAPLSSKPAAQAPATMGANAKPMPIMGDDYADVARARLEQKGGQQAPPRNVSVQAPKPLPPAPIIGTTQTSAKPLPNPTPTPAKNTNTDADQAARAEMRRQAVARLQKEDEAARTGMTTDSTSSGFGRGTDPLAEIRDRREETGGIHVVGPGNRGETGEDPMSLDEYVNDRYGGGAEDDFRNDANDWYRDEMGDAALRDQMREDIELGQQGNGGVTLDEEDINTVVDIKTGTTKDERDENEMEDIARKRLEAEQSREREAMQGELAASKSKQLMMASARAQLAGMGLSGATAALESDVARTADRSNTLAMSSMGRSQRDEARDDRRLTAQERAAAANEKRAEMDDAHRTLLRKLAIGELEETGDRDVDGDGKVNGVAVGGTVGDGDPFNDEPDPNAPSNPTEQGGFDIDDWKEEDGEMRERTQQGVPELGDRYIGSDDQYDYWIGGIGGTKFVVKHHGEPYGG